MKSPVFDKIFYTLRAPVSSVGKQPRRIGICLLAVVCIAFSGTAQNSKSTENINQLWFGYLSQTRLSNKWGTWTDLHLRTKEDFFNNFSQSIVRLGLTYYVTDVTKITAGYAYVSIYPAEGHRQITRPEHRPWQQVQWHTRYGKKRMMQWIRLEERFRRKVLNDSTLAVGSNFNYRLRYNIWYDIPLGKKGIVPSSLSFVLNDELHLNFGKEIVNNYFDQNRFFMGFKYQLNEQNNVQIGYMNQFQQLPAGNRYRSFHTVRLFYFQNFDFRKKSGQSN
ncbi:MAG: DUF2490 domain-containing protein [Ferruginibacter sp.]